MEYVNFRPKAAHNILNLNRTQKSEDQIYQTTCTVWNITLECWSVLGNVVESCGGVWAEGLS